MLDAMIPSPCRVVLYALTAADASTINGRRREADGRFAVNREAIADLHNIDPDDVPATQPRRTGYQLHVGDPVKAGDEFPMVIVRVLGEPGESTPVNGQVLLDGSDNLWVQNVKQGVAHGHWRQPQPVRQDTPDNS